MAERQGSPADSYYLRGDHMSGWEKNIRKVDPYVPGEQPQASDVIKLNTNENPYPPSPAVIRALEEMKTEDSYRKYPDPTAKDLKKALAKYYSVDKERIFIGCGSDDVLSIGFLTFFNSDKPVLFPDVTYSFYPVWAKVYGIPYEEIPLVDGFGINVDDYARDNCGGVVIANPNAPTGVTMDINKLEKIIAANRDVIVIVDEAYTDYCSSTALPLLDKYDNLVIVRTFSKSRAMAGARIGFAIAGKRLIRAMDDVAQSINSYPISATSLVAAVASVGDDKYFKDRIADVINTRARTVLELKRRGFTVLPSGTNFVFVSHAHLQAEDIFDSLREKNIYVRHFKHPKIDNYLRITIGTDNQMDDLFAAIDEII